MKKNTKVKNSNLVVGDLVEVKGYKNKDYFTVIQIFKKLGTAIVGDQDDELPVKLEDIIKVNSKKENVSEREKEEIKLEEIGDELDKQDDLFHTFKYALKGLESVKSHVKVDKTAKEIRSEIKKLKSKIKQNNKIFNELERKLYYPTRRK